MTHPTHTFDLDEVDIYPSGPRWTRTCAPAAMEPPKVEAMVNLLHPTEIASRWAIYDGRWSTDEENPHPCKIDSDRNHWLLSC